MIFYRIPDAQLIELTQDRYDALAQSKRDSLRPYVVDAKPVPSASQKVERGPLNVTDTEARQTWILIDKTAEELAAEAAEAEQRTDYQNAKQVLQALRDGTGTAAERIRRLELVVLRLARDRIKELGV